MPGAPSIRDDHQIGKILVENEMITPEQLQECADIQKRVRAVGGAILLGEVVVQKGYIDEESLLGALALQKEKLSHALVLHPLRQRGLTEVADSSIGHIAVKNGLIVQDQLDDALEIQKKVRALGVEKRIGEILVDRGHISRAGLEGLLLVQERRKKRATEAELKAVGFEASAPQDPALAAIPDAYVERMLGQARLVAAPILAECRDIQRKLAAMGIRKSLAETLLSKGHITRDIAQRIVAQFAIEGKVAPAPERAGPLLAPRDIAAILIMLALLAYVIFRDKSDGDGKPGSGTVPGGPSAAPGREPVPPPPVASGPTAAPPALVGVPPEEIEARARQFVQEQTLAAFGALEDARLTMDAAARGRAFTEGGTVRSDEFVRWFEMWEARTLALLRREPGLRDRVKSGARGAEITQLDEVVKTVVQYGRARRGELAASLRLPSLPGPSPSESPATLRARARETMEEIGEAGGFDLPEEEPDAE